MSTFRIRTISGLVVLVLLTSMGGVQADQYRHTENDKIFQGEIYVDNATMSKPEFIDRSGDVYLPLVNVMDLFMHFGYRSDWNGQALFISTKGPFQAAVPNFIPGIKGGIYLNGSLISKSPFIIDFDARAGSYTPFLAMKPVMGIFNKLSKWNTWNGDIWSFLTNVKDAKVVGPSSPILTFSDLFTSACEPEKGKVVSVARIENDQEYWKRSDTRLYIGARTSLDSKPGQLGKSLLQLEPNQTIYLYAYLDNQDTDKFRNRWFVNSPDASITPVFKNNYKINGFHVALVKFIARKPGIYTVQDDWAGVYSMPMVVVVGFNQLPFHPMRIPVSKTGIQSLPDNDSGLSAQTITDSVYNPDIIQDGWLPVVGVAPKGSSSIVVDLIDVNDNVHEWQYQLPVNRNRRYGALVRIPFAGRIEVDIYPNEMQGLNYQIQSDISINPVTSYIVNNLASTTEQQREIFASSFLNYNMNTALVQAAETLYENSPSKKTAIEAISNFASERTILDLPEYLDSFWFQNAGGVWNTQIGTFGDTVHLTAAMLRAVGIPTEIVQGSLQTGEINSNNFTWLVTPDELLTPAQPLQFDPSLSVFGNIGINQAITNQFFNSDDLNNSHTLGKNYTFYEGIY